MLDIERYENNKAFKLPKDIQKYILGKLNYHEEYVENLRKEDIEKNKEDIELLVHAANHYAEMLAELDIIVVHGWQSHGREWFFPTLADAEDELDWRETMENADESN